jgi:GT2 family glycosyltransferase
MIKIDIIILSNGKNEQLKMLTAQTIQSLHQSENPDHISFNPIVIESNSNLDPYQYEDAKTIYPAEKFGFHKYLNIGINITESKYICFCNNDLIFHNGWASAILLAANENPTIACFSTYCPKFHQDKNENIPNNINFGYQNGIHFTGWCFMVKREILHQIGLFDEKFIFWYADDDFRLTLEKHKQKNALIKNAEVTHLGSETLNNEKSNIQFALQYSANAYYQYKWKHQNRLLYLLQLLKYRIKVISKSFKEKVKL